MADFRSDSRERNGSRSTTPTGSSRTYQPNHGIRALDTRLKQSGTFFDDATPVDGSRNGDKEHDILRDSHDLSFGDGTRDSVVDNMLLSLDQLPTQFSHPPGVYPNFDNNDFFLADPYPPPRPTHHRGHTYASSHSSDYDLHADDSSSRYSTHHSRGRRSNSSNNIPNAISRKGSLRGPWSGSKQPSGMIAEFPQAGHMRGGGKKGSKGSGSSSMDMGPGAVPGHHRLGFGNRSASFDHGNLGSTTPPVKTESILERNRPNYPSYHHEYDAAPQPTIPGGPRRAQEPPQSPAAYPPQPSYAPPQAPVPRRKNSVRSTTSFRTLRKNKSQPEPNMRLQAQEFVNASNLRDLPPIPTYQDPPAPSPTVATRKHALVSPASVSTPKEKPGFFRRVFGGGLPKSQPQLSNSSTNSNSSRVDASPASSHHRPADVDSIYSQNRPRTTPAGSNHITNQIKPSQPRAPQTAASTQSQTQQPPQPALTKKHSSFFRRRKKSVSETAKVPVMAMDFKAPPKAEVLPAQPSPGISSLRKVMNPYLNDLGGPGERPTDGRERVVGSGGMANSERPDGFSPGYKPHRDATVRAIKSGSRGTDKTTPPSSRDEQVKGAQSSSTDSPKLKLKMKHGRTRLGSTQEDSFLADSSSCNEERSGRATPSGERSTAGGTGLGETRRPRTSPTSSSFAHSRTEGRNDHKALAGQQQRADHLLSPQSQSQQSSDAKAAPSGSPSASASEVEDDGWVITTPTKHEHASVKKSVGRSKRVWLDTTSSDDKFTCESASASASRGEGDGEGDDAGDLTLPLEGARSSSQKPFEKESPTSVPATTPSSTNEVFHSATSLPTVQVEGHQSDSMPAIDEHRLQHDIPTDSDRERAFRIFNGDDPCVHKAQAAAVLGDVTLTSTRTRKAFMDLFDWTGFSVLAAMRDLCGKLILKAETQQVDRILMSLSERWCECNPAHGFKAIGRTLRYPSKALLTIV